MQLTESITSTLNEVMRLEAALLRHLVEGFEAGLRYSQAEEVVREGLEDFARWRGQRARTAHLTSGVYLDARDLFSRWSDAELTGPLALGRATARGSSSHASATIEWLPHVEYLLESGRRDIADRYYDIVMPVFCAAYHPEVRGSARLAADARSVELETSVEILPVDEVHTPITTEILGHPAALRMMIRRQVQNRGALFACLAKAAVRAHDATGEMALREGLRSYGRERGAAQRERHLSAGLEPNLKTLMSNFDVPVEDAWEWQDEGVLTEQSWSQNCTFCPHVPVWKELDALDLGNIYDVEVHTSQFTAYHPDIQVKWDQLQTRGDAQCQFRFTIPTREPAPSRVDDASSR